MTAAAWLTAADWLTMAQLSPQHRQSILDVTAVASAGHTSGGQQGALGKEAQSVLTL